MAVFLAEGEQIKQFQCPGKHIHTNSRTFFCSRRSLRSLAKPGRNELPTCSRVVLVRARVPLFGVALDIDGRSVSTPAFVRKPSASSISWTFARSLRDPPDFTASRACPGRTSRMTSAAPCRRCRQRVNARNGNQLLPVEYRAKHARRHGRIPWRSSC